jgi:hypothetical protein
LGRDSLRHESLARSTNQGIKPCCAVFFSRGSKATPLGFMRLPAIPTLVSPKVEGQEIERVLEPSPTRSARREQGEGQGLKRLPAIPTLVSSEKERASETVDFLCLSSFSPWEKAGDEGRNVQLYLTFNLNNSMILKYSMILEY